MTGSTSRALAAAAGVLVLIGVLAQVSVPDAGAPEPTVVPVVATELVCPDARTGGNVTTTLSAVAPQPLAVGTDGQVSVGTPAEPAAIAAFGRTAGTAQERRSGVVLATPTGTGAVVGTAAAGRAPGFAMDQLTASTRTEDYGLSGTPCTEPINDAWFVGAVSDVGRFATLHLTDTEATSATVDVAVYGRDGRINAPSGLGIRVRGKDTRTVRVDRLAPAAGSVVVRVTASSGRVGAGLFAAQVDGLIPQGSDWLPVAAPPATRVVVPGLASGPGARQLTVFAPGEGTATVDVRLVGLEGAFAPAGAASVEIDRGRVTTVDLGAAAVTDDTAAVIESDVPLVAGVRWSVETDGTDELAFSAGAQPLTGPAVVAGNRITNGYATGLLLTAVDAAARVSVQTLVAGVPRGEPVVVEVPAGRTIRRTLPAAGATAWFEAVLTPLPGSGPVHGAVLRRRSIGTSVGTTLAVLRDARVTVGVPAAWPDLAR